LGVAEAALRMTAFPARSFGKRYGKGIVPGGDDSHYPVRLVHQAASFVKHKDTAAPRGPGRKKTPAFFSVVTYRHNCGKHLRRQSVYGEFSVIGMYGVGYFIRVGGKPKLYFP